MEMKSIPVSVDLFSVRACVRACARVYHIITVSQNTSKQDVFKSCLNNYLYEIWLSICCTPHVNTTEKNATSAVEFG